MAGPARADVTDEARALAGEGISLLEEGKAEQALAKLEAAEAKFHAPTHLLYIARAQRELGRAVDAHGTLVSILAEPIPDYAPDAFLKAQAQAKKDLVTLRGKVATVTIDAAGAEAVTVDGAPIEPARQKFPVALEPGDHQISSPPAGEARAEQTVSLVLGQNESVTLSLGGDTGAAIPDPTPASDPGDSADDAAASPSSAPSFWAWASPASPPAESPAP